MFTLAAVVVVCGTITYLGLKVIDLMYYRTDTMYPNTTQDLDMIQKNLDEAEEQMTSMSELIYGALEGGEDDE